MTSTYWDRQAKQFDKHSGVHNLIHEKTIVRTRSLLSTLDTVLDFGCATGEISLNLAPYVQQVHGIDISSQMIEIAQQKARDRAISNAYFIQEDIFDPCLASSAFSAVVAFNIIHLLDDVSKALARLNDLLVTGSLLITQTPCLGERGLLFDLLINPAQKLGVAPPILKLTVAELELLLSSSGFEIVETALWNKQTAVQWIVARKR